MRRLIRHPFYARRRLPSALIPILLVFAISVGFFCNLSAKIKPQIRTMAISKAKNALSVVISEETDNSLAELQLSYKDFVNIESSGDGTVSALAFRTPENARFKRLLVERLVDRMENLEPDLFSVPLGNLTGILFFSAVGPSVRVRVRSVGDVTAEYRNEFSAAGVNQTRHSIYLDLSMCVYLLIPGEIVPVTVSEQICVAETVIVGQVPDTYLNLEDGVN